MQGEPTGLTRVSDDTAGDNMAVVPVPDGAAAADFRLPNQSPAEVAARI